MKEEEEKEEAISVCNALMEEEEEVMVGSLYCFGGLLMTAIKEINKILYFCV